MNIFGPSSLSSSLKTLLDGVYFSILVLVFVLIIAITMVLSVPNLANQVIEELDIKARLKDVAGQSSQSFILMAFGLILAGYVCVIHFLRLILDNFSKNLVFHPSNTVYMRYIALSLGLIELFSYVARLIARGMFSLRFDEVFGLHSIGTWFLILMIFIISEVFRQGSKLKAEHDLTI